MESKQEDIPYFKDDEESYSDADNHSVVLEDKKQPPKQFPFQSGEKLLPFQPGGEAQGMKGNSLDIRKLSLEEKLRFGASAEQLKKNGFKKTCEGYTSFKGYLAYNNPAGDVFLFEKVKDNKGNDEYVLRLYVNNSRKP